MIRSETVHLLRGRTITVAMVGSLLLAACSVPGTPQPLGFPRNLQGTGPTAAMLVRHINCEIYNAMRTHAGTDPEHDPEAGTWDYLVSDNFVAAVDLTLDVTDAGEVDPNVSFIHPLPGGSTLSRTLSVVGQYSRTRDNSVQLQYVVDLAVLKKHFDDQAKEHNRALAAKESKVLPLPCTAEQGPQPGNNLGGDLRLHDTLADGLASLEATQDVSLYGTSGPSKAIVDASKRISELRREQPVAAKEFAKRISDVISEPSLAKILGTLMSDPTVSEADKAAVSDLNSNLAEAEQTLQLQRNDPAVRSDPSAETSIEKALASTKLFQANATTVAAKAKAPKSPGGSGGAAQGVVGSTSFQSTINFAVTYGASGGPNWTLVHFKGPGGGAGGGGATGTNLLGYNRTHSDNLKITFSPTCRDGKANPDPTTFWEAVPVCTGDGSEQKRAVAAGAQTNNVLTGLSVIRR